QINRNVAIRANLAFTRADLQVSSDAAASLTAPGDTFFVGTDFDKYFYGADLEVRYPSRVGLAPYLVLGGGAVTVNPKHNDLSSLTKPAGQVGAGLSYTFARSGLSLFGEWNGWVYKWDENTPLDSGTTNVNKTQFDTTCSSGLRFVF